MQSDAKLAGLGIAAFVAGLAVYALWRTGPAPSSAMVGLLVGSAPSLVHAFAFTLWTALALRARPRSVWVVVLAWVSVESLLEAFQHPNLYALLPAAIRTRWTGTFDRWDVVASLMGAVSAGMVALRQAVPKEKSL